MLHRLGVDMIDHRREIGKLTTEELTFERSAFKFLYGGQFTL